MNAERLRAVADAIEHEHKGIQFDMNYFVMKHSCSTTACVAGFAYMLAQEADPANLWDATNIPGVASAWLDLHFSQSNHLFYVEQEELKPYEGVTMDTITDNPAHAARALRWMADHNKIDWNEAWERT